MTIKIVLLVLATWRLGRLLSDPNESGPWEWFYKLRELVGAKDEGDDHLVAYNVFAQMIACIKCNTFWVGSALSLTLLLPEIFFWIIVLPFAVNGAAMLVDNLYDRTYHIGDR